MAHQAQSIDTADVPTVRRGRASAALNCVLALVAVVAVAAACGLSTAPVLEAQRVEQARPGDRPVAPPPIPPPPELLIPPTVNEDSDDPPPFMPSAAPPVVMAPPAVGVGDISAGPARLGPILTHDCAVTPAGLDDFVEHGPPIVGDVDGDGRNDTVTALRKGEFVGGDASPVFRLRVDFGSGGMSISPLLNASPHPAATYLAGVVDLSHHPDEGGGDEMVFSLGSGATTAQYAVFGLAGCDIVETTFVDDRLVLHRGGGAAYSLSFGCVRTPEGQLRVKVYRDEVVVDPTGQQEPQQVFSTQDFALRGLEWSVVGGGGGQGPIGLGPTIPTIASCGF